MAPCSNCSIKELGLVAEDGLSFTVEKIYLQVNSGFFKNMTSIPESTPSPPSLISAAASMSALTTAIKPTTPHPCTPVIEIPAHSSVLHFVIELMKQTDIREVTPGQFAGLYPGGAAEPMVYVLAFGKLLDWLDCSPVLLIRGLGHFEAAFATDPWSVFVIATKCDDLRMAKRGIDTIGKLANWQIEKKYNPAIMSLQLARTIPLPWLVGYYRAFAIVLESQNGRVSSERILYPYPSVCPVSGRRIDSYSWPIDTKVPLLTLHADKLLRSNLLGICRRKDGGAGLRPS